MLTYCAHGSAVVSHTSRTQARSPKGERTLLLAPSTAGTKKCRARGVGTLEVLPPSAHRLHRTPALLPIWGRVVITPAAGGGSVVTAQLSLRRSAGTVCCSRTERGLGIRAPGIWVYPARQRQAPSQKQGFRYKNKGRAKGEMTRAPRLYSHPK